MRTSSLDILEESQLSSPQARAILHVMELEFSAQYGELATKTDLSAAMLATKTDLSAAMLATKADIAVLRAEMATKADIARLELKIESGRVEMFRWLIASYGMLLGAFYFLLNYARK